MGQLSTVGMMQSMIPISRFNKGEANKIFDEVELSGTKIVMKNNKPACVLLSPTEYENLIETLSDYMLYVEAENRMLNNNNAENLSFDEVMNALSITEEDIADIDVEIG